MTIWKATFWKNRQHCRVGFAVQEARSVKSSNIYFFVFFYYFTEIVEVVRFWQMKWNGKINTNVEYEMNVYMHMHMKTYLYLDVDKYLHMWTNVYVYIHIHKFMFKTILIQMKNRKENIFILNLFVTYGSRHCVVKLLFIWQQV